METVVDARVPALIDDLWPADVHGGASSDDSFVEDLLNFSFADEEPEVGKEEEEEEDKCFLSASSSETLKPVGGDSAKDDFAPGDEIIFPTDDVADLEWLSHFVEDSFSERSVALPEISTVNNRSEPGSAQFGFQTPVPAKARSKRGRARSFRFSPYSSSSILPTRFHISVPVQFGSKAPMSKPKKQPALAERGSGRRCSHCGVQKTPQWRAGPMGPKTLCNACGVRFKSGRLFPEYRPACSPQFSNELHSNHHRKVLEMRRKKEIPGQPEEPLPGFIRLDSGSSVQ